MKKPSTDAQRKAEERERKRDLGLIQRTYWLKPKSLEALNKLKVDGKTYDQIINELILGE